MIKNMKKLYFEELRLSACSRFLGSRSGLVRSLALIAAMGINGVVSAQEDSLHIDLGEVVVSDCYAQGATPISNTTMHREEVDERRTETSLPYVIELQPSVVTSGENGKVGNTSFRVRGVDGARISVGINGITLNDPESQTVYWVNIPNLAGMSQSMQLQRGVGGATGGTASFGGALDIETMSSAVSPYASADVAVGSWNTRQYSISAGTGVGRHDMSLDVAYSGLTSDGFVHGGFCDHQSLFLSGFKCWERSVLRAIAIIGQQHTGITWDGASAEQLDADPRYNPSGLYTDASGVVHRYGNESDNYSQNHYQLYFYHQLGRYWGLKAIADFTQGRGYYEQAGEAPEPFGREERASGSLSGEVLTAVTRRSEDNNALAGNVSAKYHRGGFELTMGEALLSFVGDHYGRALPAGDALDHGELFATAENWYFNQGHKQDATTFVKMNCDFSKRLSLYADMQLRGVHYTIEGEDDDNMALHFDEHYLFFNPKAGVNWTTGRNRLYAVAGVSHREPARADIKENVKHAAGEAPEPFRGGSRLGREERASGSFSGAVPIRAEAMLDIELGYQHTAHRWSASANGYAMLYKDQLTPMGQLNSGGYALMENVDKSYRLGVELMGGCRLTKWMQLDANLTLSSNKIIDYTFADFESGVDSVATNRTANTDLSFSPNVVGAAVATFEPWKNAKLQLIGKYVGAMYCDNTSREAVRQDAYFVANVKASYSWDLLRGGKLTAELLVNNIFNNMYRLSAWTADYAYDGVLYTERAYYQQPGTNIMARVKVEL